MVKREKYDHLHLVCHFAIPLKASLSHFLEINSKYQYYSRTNASTVYILYYSLPEGLGSGP